MRWILEVVGNFTTLVSIYHIDGGVTVSHGGVEMGQGINTKVSSIRNFKMLVYNLYIFYLGYKNFNIKFKKTRNTFHPTYYLATK